MAMGKKNPGCGCVLLLILRNLSAELLVNVEVLLLNPLATSFNSSSDLTATDISNSSRAVDLKPKQNLINQLGNTLKVVFVKPSVDKMQDGNITISQIYINIS